MRISAPIWRYVFPSPSAIPGMATAQPPSDHQQKIGQESMMAAPGHGGQQQQQPRARKTSSTSSFLGEAKREGKEGSKKKGEGYWPIARALLIYMRKWEQRRPISDAQFPFIPTTLRRSQPAPYPLLRLPINQLFLRQNRRKRKAKKWFGLANK